MRVITLSVLAICTSACFAQQGLITHSWTTTEVLAASNTPVTNPNGVIELGEGMRLSVTISYTPPFGTVVTFQAPLGTFTGPVEGLASAWFSLQGFGGVQGTWTGFEMGPGLFGYAGEPSKGGTFLQGCVIADPNPPNATNPIVNAWSQVWTPASYAPRTVTFNGLQPANLFSALHVRTGINSSGQPVYGSWPVPVQYASTQIQIAPAPGTITILAAAALTAACRRRPTRWKSPMPLAFRLPRR